MNKKIYKKTLTTVLVTGMVLCSFSGCTATDKNNNHNDIHKANTEKSDKEELYEEKEGWWTKEMEQFKEYETKLQVDSKKKNTFLKKYGEETYYSALSSSINFLLLNNNSTVSDNGIEGLKSKYDVKMLNLESTFDNHTIPADYITSESENRDTIIFVHGQGCDRRTNLGIASRFLDHGYNILTFDLRNSGENKAPFTTFGALEKYDLQDYVNYVAQRVKKPNKIIIWGASYGGSVVAAGLDMKDINEKVDYVILDSPVANMESMIRIRMKEYVKDDEIDDIIKACNLFLKEIIGFSMEDANGINSIKNTKIPVLIFASKADCTVPFEVSKSLYDAIENENKKLYVFKNVGHCMGSTSQPKRYFETVNNFLAEDK